MGAREFPVKILVQCFVRVINQLDFDYGVSWEGPAELEPCFSKYWHLYVGCIKWCIMTQGQVGHMSAPPACPLHLAPNWSHMDATEGHLWGLIHLSMLPRHCAGHRRASRGIWRTQNTSGSELWERKVDQRLLRRSRIGIHLSVQPQSTLKDTFLYCGLKIDQTLKWCMPFLPLPGVANWIGYVENMREGLDSGSWAF